MGKTFRREKSFKPKRNSMRGLNTHRDLPDYPEYFDKDVDYDDGYEEEDYDAQTIRPKEFNSIPAKDRQNPKINKG